MTKIEEWRKLLCRLGFHRLHPVGPLLNRCTDCRALYLTDYFESRARGRIVRYRVKEIP